MYPNRFPKEKISPGIPEWPVGQAKAQGKGKRPKQKSSGLFQDLDLFFRIT